MLQESVEGNFVFRRDANTLPSIGEAVLMPTETQLRSIVESGEERRVKVGSSPMAGEAEVYVDPDRLFGHHLAVLGSTGSGKSCSVAGLIRWSLEAAKGAYTPVLSEQDPESSQHVSAVNARFLVLDPNGEYSKAFSRNDATVKARVFRVNPADGELATEGSTLVLEQYRVVFFHSGKCESPATSTATSIARGQSWAHQDLSIDRRREAIGTTPVSLFEADFNPE